MESPVSLAWYTAAQLCELIDVSRQRLQSWIARGLVVPLNPNVRPLRFGFLQLSRARTLKQLSEAGLQLGRIGQNIASLERWIDAPGTPLDCVQLVGGGRMAARCADGRLIEPGGQLSFDFQVSPSIGTRAFPAATPVCWFELGCQLEDDGRMAEAAAAYREALRATPRNATVHFNLANTLFSLGELEAAAEHLRQAVEIDPRDALAWNNRGVVLDELGQLAEAVAAFRRSLALQPSYQDARHNLECTLQKLRIDQGFSPWQRAAAGKSQPS